MGQSDTTFADPFFQVEIGQLPFLIFLSLPSYKSCYGITKSELRDKGMDLILKSTKMDVETLQFCY